MKKLGRKQASSVCKQCKGQIHKDSTKLSSSHGSNCNACCHMSKRRDSNSFTKRPVSQIRQRTQRCFNSNVQTLTHPLAASLDNIYLDQGVPVITNIKIDPNSARMFNNTQQLGTYQSSHFASNGMTFSPVQTQSPYRSTLPQPIISTPVQMHPQRLSLSPTKSIQKHYDKVIQEIELSFRQRMLNLREGLSRVQENFKTDEIISAMREDPSTSGYVYQRMREVLDNYLIVEQETTLSNLRSDNIILRERVLFYEAQYQTEKKGDSILKTEKKLKKYRVRKNLYKKQLIETQNHMQQLIERLKEYEKELNSTREQYEYKLAQKEGEMVRCERILSETRAMLSEKTMNENRTHNNFSCEMSALQEKVHYLEKEKSELKEKYNRYGEDVGSAVKQESGRYQDKISQLKAKIKDLEIRAFKDQNLQKELESQLKSYLKEIENQRMKIDELVKQSQSNLFKAHEAEEKLKLGEERMNEQVKQEKFKCRSKVTSLQNKFERAMEDKLREIEEGNRLVINKLEQEKMETGQEIKKLSVELKDYQDREKEQLMLQQISYEKKIDKLSAKFESEITTKMSEAESQFKDMESQMKKQFKKERKQLIEEMETLSKTHEVELFKQQQTYETSYNEISTKLRNEISELNQRRQDLQHQAHSHLEQLKEKDFLIQSQLETITRLKEEVKIAEDKLKEYVEQNNTKVKQALDDAIKQHTAESLAQQLSREVDKKSKEFENEVQRREYMEQKIRGYEEQLVEMKFKVDQYQRMVEEKDYVIQRQRIYQKDLMSKVQLMVKSHSTKYRQELDFLRKQFQQETEMNKKNMENVITIMGQKIKDLQLQQKFKLEKLKYVFEQKFEQEFSKRESEWEKAWEKRESQLQIKDSQIKDLSTSVTNLQNKIQLNDLHYQQSLQRIEALKEENQTILNRMRKNDAKHEEILNQCKIQEEKLKINYNQQVSDVKNKCEQKAQEEIRKLEDSMRQYRETHKKKLSDVEDLLKEKESRFKSEMVNLKQVFEQKLKQLESEKSDQQKNLYEFKSNFSLLELRYDQTEKEKQKIESEYNEIKQRERQQSQKLQEITIGYESVNKENEQSKQEREQLEKEVQEYKDRNMMMQQQLQEAHREMMDQRKKLKQAARKLNQSKKREQKEIQILNDILTKSIVKSEKKHFTQSSSVYSPDFRTQNNPIQITSRCSSRSRSARRTLENDNNYQSIMTEINSILDNNSNTLRASVTRDRPRSILKNKNNLVISSPKVYREQMMTNYNKYNKTCTNALSLTRSKENTNTLSLQDLNQK